MPYGKSLHISGNIVDRMSKRVLTGGKILPCDEAIIRVFSWSVNCNLN